MKNLSLLSIFLLLSTTAYADTTFEGTYASLMITQSKVDVNENQASVFYPDNISQPLYKFDGLNSADFNGLGGSLRFGFNKIFDQNLIGIELSSNFLNASKDYRLNTYFRSPSDNYETLGNDSALLIAKTTLRSFHTLGLRAGHIFDEKTLVYLSGGIALGNIKRSFEDKTDELSTPWLDPNQPTSETLWKTGYSLGVGIEHKLNDQIAFRASYEYVDFNSINDTYKSSSFGERAYIKSNADLSLNSLSLGLTYKF